MSNLVIVEHVVGGYRPALLNVIHAVSKAGGKIDLLLAGKNCGDAAKALAAIAGVGKILVADDASYEHGLAESIAPLVVGVAKGYQAVWASADTYGKNIMPRIAALLDSQQISDITAVKGNRTYERPIYAGNAMATVQSSEAIDVITVRATAFDAGAATGGSASIEALSQKSDQSQSHYEGAELSSSERPELTGAKIVISGGRGMQDGKNFVMLDRIADKLGAAVGASRAAVDAGFVPNDYQVGQTGKVVAPELYIAVGISGAIQHLAGMKDSKVIVAINKDEDAPIFQVADYGLVADLFDALPLLEKELG